MMLISSAKLGRGIIKKNGSLGAAKNETKLNPNQQAKKMMYFTWFHKTSLGYTDTLVFYGVGFD